MRWLSLVIGTALVVLAFAAASRVADTRQGLIAEVITLLSGVAGIGLLLYGIFSGARPSPTVARMSTRVATRSIEVRSANDLVIGSAGIALAVVLLGGIAMTGGFAWAALGMILLAPMIVGSSYLAARFIRAPDRDWRVGLRPPRKGADQKEEADRDQSRGPDHAPADESEVLGEKQSPRRDQDGPEQD
jgi:hypothetical protein